MSQKSADNPNRDPAQPVAVRWIWRLALLLVFLYAFRAYQQQGVISGPVKPLFGEALNGAPVAPKPLAGRVGVIHFWATWCEVCRTMNGSVAAVSRDFPVVTVASLSGSKEQVGGYLRTNRLSFPVLVDSEGRLAVSYGVAAFPTTIVVDKKGKIRFTEIGYTTEIGLRARLWLASKL